MNVIITYIMKKVFISILLFLPLFMSAQNVLTPQQQLEQAQKQLEEAKKAVEAAKAAKAAAEKAATEQKAAAEAAAKAVQEKELKPSIANEPTTLPTKTGWVVPTAEKKDEAKPVVKNATGAVLKKDPKYLEGAITTDKDGKVEFTLDTDANGKTANQIYEIVYQYLQGLVDNKNNIRSRVALVNPQEHVIASTMDEWFVFNTSFISLDRAEARYQLVAKIADNHLDFTLSRLFFNYEEGRSTGFKDAAENVITDKFALNKKKTDLAKIYGKFRKATIDRKDQIFSEITALVKQ